MVFRRLTGKRSERFLKSVCNACPCPEPAAGVTAEGTENAAAVESRARSGARSAQLGSLRCDSLAMGSGALPCGGPQQLP